MPSVPLKGRGRRSSPNPIWFEEHGHLPPEQLAVMLKITPAAAAERVRYYRTRGTTQKNTAVEAYALPVLAEPEEQAHGWGCTYCQHRNRCHEYVYRGGATLCELHYAIPEELYCEWEPATASSV